MVRDMFQVAVLENMPMIKKVRGLGKNFFHIELGNGSLAQPLAELKVLELKYDKVLLQPWCSLSLPFSWPPLRKKSRYLVTSKRRRATLETGKDPLRECGGTRPTGESYQQIYTAPRARGWRPRSVGSNVVPMRLLMFFPTRA